MIPLKKNILKGQLDINFNRFFATMLTKVRTKFNFHSFKENHIHLMRTFMLAFILMLSPTFFVLAQDGYYHEFSAKKSTGNSGTGANIDVNYYRCEWTIDPRTTSKTITGKVTVKFKTTNPNVKTITVDLNTVSFNNASTVVKYHGTTCTRSLGSNILTITLPSTIVASGTLDSLEINYSGVPPGVNGAAQGYQSSTDGDGIRYVNTLSESYEDRDWWPCKADMQDKADSMDIYVKAPWASSGMDTFWVASNGVLKSSPISGGWRTFHFKTNYPIASYLVAVSVARFKRFYNTVNVNGTIVPVEYDLLAGKTNSYYTNAVNAMNKINQVVVAFSDKFGDYPFKNEKHGFYDGLLGADGMEHQTFSCIQSGALTSLGTLTHELMHQWFGDKVSFSTWNDLWLAEGFARYSEALGPELLPSVFGSSPSSIRLGWKNRAQTNYVNVGAWIPNSSMGNSNLIWNSNYGGAVYDRGGMVVSMLRTLLGDDKFFQACRNYMNDPDLAYKSATSADLQAHMEAMCGGYDLSGFFNSFVFGNGYPSYNSSNSIKWAPLGSDRIIIKVDGQSKSSGSNVGYYFTPIALRVTGSGGKDTVIVVYDEGPNKLSVAGNGITPGSYSAVNVYLGFVPTAVTFDSYNQTLASGSTTKEVALPVTISSFDVKNTSRGNVASLTLTDKKSVNSVVLESSNDGTSFISVGNMNSSSDNLYTITDATGYNNNVYYRAKVIMVTGEIQYSAIVKISSQRSVSAYSILENPVHGKIQVMVPASESGASVSFTIFDLSGRKMLETTRKVMHGLNEISCNIPKGNYVLRIDGRDQSETLKFLVD